ncbi:MAG: right-handed parallel beta-helix repeat-containing protein, partial [Planktotalea sp.]
LFRSTQGTIDRVERINTTFASLNMSSVRDVLMNGNTFLNVVTGTENPLTLEHSQNNHAQTWYVSFAGRLPFGGNAQQVTSVIHHGKIKTPANVTQYTAPWITAQTGSNGDIVEVDWEKDVRGAIKITARMDS